MSEGSDAPSLPDPTATEPTEEAGLDALRRDAKRLGVAFVGVLAISIAGAMLGGSGREGEPSSGSSSSTPTDTDTTDPAPEGVSVEAGAIHFKAYCASCHGEEGKTPLPGTPTLNSPNVLAVVDDDYYERIIAHGRSNTAMMAWDQMLSPDAIKSLVAYIRSWQSPGPDRSLIDVAKGDVTRGKALFHGNCAACHGTDGRGGIGNNLRSPSFQALASDEFLRDTIIYGRGHTAMPSGKRFDAGQISDVLAYLRSWREPAYSYDDVAALRTTTTRRNVRVGKSIYGARCAACHGKQGEGGIGSRLNSQSFLSLASDEFLFRSIVRGRPGTAMPQWHFLEAADVADLITFLRDWQEVESAPPEPKHKPGDAEAGAALYASNCVECHGEEGRGGVGGQIGNREFLACADDAFLFRTIAYGKSQTAMRGFLKGSAGGPLVSLKATEIDDIVAYLRKLEQRPTLEPLRRPRSRVEMDLGREVYTSLGGCAKCHGEHGEGASGPAIGNPDFLKVATDGFLVGTVILGREGTSMLSFNRGGNVSLTPREVEAVVTYIRAFENEPFERRPLPEPSPTELAEGGHLFRVMCAGCHGSDGKGPLPGQELVGFAPSINNPEFLGAASDGMLLATIALGRAGTAMRPFGRGVGGVADLTADEIQKIVAHIRTWQKP